MLVYSAQLSIIYTFNQWRSREQRMSSAKIHASWLMRSKVGHIESMEVVRKKCMHPTRFSDELWNCDEFHADGFEAVAQLDKSPMLSQEHVEFCPRSSLVGDIHHIKMEGLRILNRGAKCIALVLQRIELVARSYVKLPSQHSHWASMSCMRCMSQNSCFKLTAM